MCQSRLLGPGDAGSERSCECVAFPRLLRSFIFAEYPFVVRGEKQISGACTNFVDNPLFTVIISFPYKLSRLLLFVPPIFLSSNMKVLI